jgi:hypothetical protein
LTEALLAPPSQRLPVWYLGWRFLAMMLLPLIVERIKEQVEPFSHGGMGEHSIADLLVRKRPEHSHLQRRNDFAGVVAKQRRTKD